MISVITPTHNTPPEVLARTWASLKAQSFRDWEWVVWDDSTDPAVSAQLYGMASDERYRLVVHRSHTHSGSIGQVKRRAFMVAEGDYLVELDHDDELTPDALWQVNMAFNDGDPGFVFSDWCELKDGQSTRYPDGWAFGYGSHYWDNLNEVWVMKTPEINRTTLSHIVSVPNHLRAWDADAYRRVGGHDPGLFVADDYDLIVRTLLQCDYHHIAKMLYKQHIGGHTAQRKRNQQIQSAVGQIHARYSKALDDKFGTLRGNSDD